MAAAAMAACGGDKASGPKTPVTVLGYWIGKSVMVNQAPVQYEMWIVTETADSLTGVCQVFVGQTPAGSCAAYGRLRDSSLTLTLSGLNGSFTGVWHRNTPDAMTGRVTFKYFATQYTRDLTLDRPPPTQPFRLRAL
jgi:hypothetical protein